MIENVHASIGTEEMTRKRGGDISAWVEALNAEEEGRGSISHEETEPQKGRGSHEPYPYNGQYDWENIKFHTNTDSDNTVSIEGGLDSTTTEDDEFTNYAINTVSTTYSSKAPVEWSTAFATNEAMSTHEGTEPTGNPTGGEELESLNGSAESDLGSDDILEQEPEEPIEHTESDAVTAELSDHAPEEEKVKKEIIKESRCRKFITRMREKISDAMLVPVTSAQMRAQDLKDAYERTLFNDMEPERAKRNRRLVKTAVGAAAVYGAYRFGQSAYEYVQGGEEAVSSTGAANASTPDVWPSSIPEFTPEGISSAIGLPEGVVTYDSEALTISLPKGESVSLRSVESFTFEHSGLQGSLENLGLQNVSAVEALDAVDVIDTDHLNDQINEKAQITITDKQIENAADTTVEYADKAAEYMGWK